MSINQAHTDCRKYLSSTLLKTEAKSVENSATGELEDSCEVGRTLGKYFYDALLQAALFS